MDCSVFKFLGFSVVALTAFAGASGCVAASDSDLVAMKVYDQNWGERVVRKHNISVNGTPGTTSDADAYYVINIP